jgi:tRNA(Ile)-lysidine synthase
MTGHKLVSDFLTDLKLTVVAKRCQLVVTDCEGNILWVVGQRTDNRYRITAQTTSMLSIVLR